MRRIVPLLLLLSLLLLLVSTGVQAATGGYTVKPHVHNQDLIDKGLIDSSGADATITFRELPLWIQIFYISGILVTIFGMFKGIPLVLGRIKDLFGNQNRKTIFEYVSENPGCTIAEASENLRINRGSVKYHIMKLNAESKITTVKTGKFTRLFKNSGVFDKDEKVIASYLRNKTSRMLLLSILENPGITNQDLAEIFNLDKSTIHWYLNKFQNSNTILYVTEGKFKKCFVNPALERDLLKFMPL
ncbi:MAG: winged helix-turn-helix transcriptional regulator [Methanogenium sp.]|nr:winged helix-turn-helix transcriptional regulator [Methanogenium sp.]